MRFEIRTATAALLSIGAATACGVNTTDPVATAPTVAMIAASSAPTPPAGNVALCYDDPAGTASVECPVITWNNVTYWVFAFTDPRNSLNVVAYDDNDNILDELEVTGTRQLYDITINTNNQNVALHGFNAVQQVVAWSVLLAMQGTP